jgi:hypothetical protein
MSNTIDSIVQQINSLSDTELLNQLSEAQDTFDEKGSFDERRIELQNLDEIIVKLKNDKIPSKMKQIQLLKYMELSKRGWYKLYSDIMDREG